jgi:hypothetical protein
VTEWGSIIGLKRGESCVLTTLGGNNDSRFSGSVGDAPAST